MSDFGKETIKCLEAIESAYQKGRADLLMPYDVESIDDLIENVKSKAREELIEEILERIDAGVCEFCEFQCEGCFKTCDEEEYEKKALIKWLEDQKND